MVSTSVVQSGSVIPAFTCFLVHRPTMPQESYVAEGSRGPTATSCKGRKGDSEKACDLTEVTQQIKGENERTRVSHCSLLPFVFRGPGDAKIPLEGL